MESHSISPLTDPGEADLSSSNVIKSSLSGADDTDRPPTRSTTTTTKRAKKKGRSTGFRKAPGAPRRFKSPYIMFSISQMTEYKKSMQNVQVTSVSRQIAQDWKVLSDGERKKWDQMALHDKRRYNAEKELYTGPWQIPSKRSRKDPSAPKRPASAFLFYCQTKRSQLKQEHPDLKNTEISKLLGQHWKSAPMDERKPHIEREQRERDAYKTRIAEWRQQREEQERSARKQREAETEQYMKSGTYPVLSSAPAHPASAPGAQQISSPTASDTPMTWGFTKSFRQLGQMPFPLARSIQPPTAILPKPAPRVSNSASEDTNGCPRLPFSYLNGEIIETTPSGPRDTRLFPSFFQGDTQFDPPLASLLE